MMPSQPRVLAAQDSCAQPVMRRVVPSIERGERATNPLPRLATEHIRQPLGLRLSGSRASWRAHSRRDRVTTRLRCRPRGTGSSGVARVSVMPDHGVKERPTQLVRGPIGERRCRARLPNSAYTAGRNAPTSATDTTSHKGRRTLQGRPRTAPHRAVRIHDREREVKVMTTASRAMKSA